LNLPKRIFVCIDDFLLIDLLHTKMMVSGGVFQVTVSLLLAIEGMIYWDFVFL
jgi:hypothetical protein